MTETQMADIIKAHYCLIKNEENGEYISNFDASKQGALIAVELLQQQTFINPSSYYSHGFWDNVHRIIKNWKNEN